MYLTPPLTPPFPNSGVKYIDELTDDSTNGSVKSFDQLIDNLWFLLRMMLDGVEKRMGITGTSTTISTTTGQYWYEARIRQIIHRH
jgi:hypothetical protein